MLTKKSMKKMLRQTFFVFEPEQYLEMGNYKYSFDRTFIICWQMELVWVFFFFFGTYIMFTLSFDCVAFLIREMKSVSAISFMTKVMAM